jgi:hypothetical protein
VGRIRTDSPKVDTGKWVTREELKKIVEKIQEIDEKREADRKLILGEFDNLKKEITQILKESTPPQSKRPRAAVKPETQEKAPEKPADAPVPSQEGVWHSIEKDNTFSAIAAAYNEEFKKQGKKTSIKLIEDANPGVKPTSLKIGQKIFVPLVPL